MIDISNTMLALSEDSATQEEIQDVARCLRTLYSTPLGSQEGDRSLGIDQGVFLDKPIEVAKALYVREVTEKTAEFEPRARVVRVDWLESDVVRGEVIPKVVYELVYYDNIVHEVALAQFSQYLAREIKDPEELADVMDKLRLAFRTFELDVSRFADEEIEKMYHEKVRSTLNVGVPSSALTGEKMLRKGADIGNQVSQNTGIFLPVPIDNYVKIVCAVKGYGRYSDDFYIIDKSKEHLQEVMAGVRQWAAKLGIIINEKKTHICKLSGQYRHLQVLYSLQEDGRIIRKISPKAITRERRKLKAYKRKMDAGVMIYAEIENSYKSWICANYKYMSRKQIHNMTNLFKDLFGKEPTWKKHGHGRLRWLMAH